MKRVLSNQGKLVLLILVCSLLYLMLILGLYRKIFVGGLSWDTTPESMRAYFENFGEVTDCVVMKNPGVEGKPRGFGFVTFANSSSVEKVTSHGKHILDNKAVSDNATSKGCCNIYMYYTFNRCVVNGRDAMAAYL